MTDTALPRLAARFDEIEAQIRSAQMRVSQEQLAAIRLDALPRAHWARFAELARRAGVPQLSIRLLNPVVRPPARKPIEATDQERDEYAGALIRLGGAGEALTLLEAIDAHERPQALMFKGFAHISRWDYPRAAPSFERLAAHPLASDYVKLIARVNLAACWVFLEDVGRAEPLLSELRETTRAQSNFLLLGSSLNLSAQTALLAGRLGQAEGFLSEAETTLSARGTASSADQLYIRKWRAILHLRNRTAGADAMLARVRREALDRQDAETLRDCDFQEARVFIEQSPGRIPARARRLMEKVFFGTPFAGYRARIAQHYLHLPERYAWLPAPLPSAGRTTDWLNATSGEASRGAPLKGGQAMHRLILTLAGDFYRRRRVLELHAEIYPGRFFNPESSADQIHQLLKRTRHHLTRAGLPLEILEHRATYGLRAARGFRILLERPASATDASPTGTAFARLRAIIRSPFNAADTARALGISRRAAGYMIRRWLDEGRVTRHGAAARTTYRFR